MPLLLPDFGIQRYTPRRFHTGSGWAYEWNFRELVSVALIESDQREKLEERGCTYNIRAVNSFRARIR